MMSTPEPPPKPNKGAIVWEIVIEDMKARDAAGRYKYGTPLQTNNGRKQLVDAYQEALDLVVYLRAEIEERRALKAALLKIIEKIDVTEPPALSVISGLQHLADSL